MKLSINDKASRSNFKKKFINNKKYKRDSNFTELNLYLLMKKRLTTFLKVLGREDYIVLGKLC